MIELHCNISERVLALAAAHDALVAANAEHERRVAQHAAHEQRLEELATIAPGNPKLLGELAELRAAVESGPVWIGAAKDEVVACCLKLKQALRSFGVYAPVAMDDARVLLGRRRKELEDQTLKPVRGKLDAIATVSDEASSRLRALETQLLEIPNTQGLHTEPGYDREALKHSRRLLDLAARLNEPLAQPLTQI